MLVLEIEWLRGVAVLARDPADPAPDWPPHPDRIFSALVASWGARGESPQERVALEWLEQQAPPRLLACAAEPRSTVNVYVPVNDTVGQIGPQPEARPRQPRRFQTARIAEPGRVSAQLSVVWDASPDDATLNTLQALAYDTSYVGHSSSLVRCRFTRQDEAPPRPEGWFEPSRPRAPYGGRLAELERIHKRHIAGDERARARPSSRTRAPEAHKRCLAQSIFSPDWIVLSHVGGERPDPLITAVIAKTMRDALMSVWPEQPVPPWLSGHEADSSPLRDPHLAVLPLLDAGHDHADGHLMGLALVPPRALAARWNDSTPAAWRERRALTAALEKLGEGGHGSKEEGTIRLLLGQAGTWDIAVDDNRIARALRPERYCKPARRFATVTPIALDRHPKGDHVDRSSEAKRLVARACTRIGLPEPAQIALSKHAAPRGAHSARPPGGAPAWATWARPGALGGKVLAHAVIEFAEDIEGPVVLGAGRFFGLGLCLPIGDAP
jgi:CRISPR-associated protein Csb2